MVPHLSKCVLIAPDVRDCAVAEINDTKLNHHGNPPDPPTSMLGRSVSMPLPTMASGYPPCLNSGLSTSATPSGLPSPSLLLLSVPLLNIDQPSKCARVLSFTSPDSPKILTGTPYYSRSLGKTYVNCLLQLSLHGTLQTIHRCNYLLRNGYQTQSYLRRTLLGSILDREAGKVEDKLRLKLKGQKATFQTEGGRTKLSKQSLQQWLVWTLR